MTRKQIIILVVLGLLCVCLLIYKITSARQDAGRPDQTSLDESVRTAGTSTAKVVDNRWPGAVSASTVGSAVSTSSTLEDSTTSKTATSPEQPKISGQAESAAGSTSEQQVSSTEQLEREVEQRLAALRARTEKDSAAAPSSTSEASSTPTIKQEAESPSSTPGSSQSDRAEILTLQEQVVELQRKLRDTEGELTMLRTRDRSDSSKSSSLANENSRLRSKVEEAGAQSDRSRSTIVELERQIESLRAEVTKNKREKEDLARESDRLRQGFDRLVERTKNEKQTLERDSQKSKGKLEADLALVRESLEKLKKEKSELQKERDELIASSKNLDAAREVAKKAQVEQEVRLTALEQQSESYRNELSATRDQLDTASKQVASLQKELVDARSDLMLAKAQLEAVGKATTSNASQSSARSAPTHSTAGTPQTAVQVPRREAGSTSSATVAGEFQFIEVSVPKANLRAGPGDEHSVVMEVPIGSVLSVEDRRGNWFRIVSPTGSRAWISADVVKQPDASEGRRGASSRSSRVTPIQPRVVPGNSVAGRTESRSGSRAANRRGSVDDVDDEATKAYQKLRDSLGGN